MTREVAIQQEIQENLEDLMEFIRFERELNGPDDPRVSR